MKYFKLDINKKEELKKVIYNLREQRLSYSNIAMEIKKQGIDINTAAVLNICKEIYASKGKMEPKARNIHINRKESLSEKIYELRKQGLNYTNIVKKLRKEGIRISSATVEKKCKEIYRAKGEVEFKSLISEESEKINEKIYQLRGQGLSYAKIAEKLGERGVQISSSTVEKKCKEIYSTKRQIEPNYPISEESKELNQEINKFREQGLTYQEISNKLKENGTILTRQGIEQRYKRFLKLNEQQLAKAILNLVITRKATMEQMQQISDYYGVDLEKTMNSLKER